ncbi:MAG TPA: acyltransferase [Rhizomicrobium sp.]|nr:acyltransferase [Rhizomicrobium sp.]
MRMKHLDTLRAMALGLVMVEHFGGRTLNDFIPIGAGSVGVGCFFTLSGFLITGILLESFDARPGAKGSVWIDFYARRMLRLMPAYYAVIAGLVLLGIAPVVQSWPWDASYLTNVHIALGAQDTVFWSLSVEEQFYLFWPFAIAFVPRRWLPATVLAMMGFSLLFKLGIILGGFDPRSATRLLPGNLVLLGAGCLLAVVSYRGQRANCFTWYEGSTKRAFTVAAWVALGLAVLSWAIIPKEGGLVRYFSNDILCGTFYAWLVLNCAIGVRGPLKAFFDNSVLQYVGCISYGLYLVHNWIPDIVTKFLGPMPKFEAAPIVLAVTFGVCILSWHLFEKPVLRLKRYFWNAPLDQPRAPTAESGGQLADSQTANAY